MGGGGKTEILIKNIGEKMLITNRIIWNSLRGGGGGKKKKKKKKKPKINSVGYAFGKTRKGSNQKQ